MSVILSRRNRGISMGRESTKSRETYKILIDKIKEGSPIAWHELKKATNLADKTLSRALDNLEYWGLIKKDEKRSWNWFEFIVTYESEAEHKIALEHSKNLDKGLLELYNDVLKRTEKPTLFSPHFGMEGAEISTMESMVEEHAKTAYPKLEELINNFNDIMVKRYYLLDETRKLVSILKIVNVERESSEFDLIKNLANWKNYLFFRGTEPENEYKWETEYKWKVPKEYRKNINRLMKEIPTEKIKQITEIENNLLQVAMELLDEIQKLHMQILLKNLPLKGKCQFCPNIKIKNIENPSQSIKGKDNNNNGRNENKKKVFLAKDFKQT